MFNWIKNNKWIFTNIIIYISVMTSLSYLSMITVDETTSVFRQKSNNDGKQLLLNLYYKYDKDLKLICDIMSCNYIVIYDKLRNQDIIYDSIEGAVTYREHDPSVEYNFFNQKIILNYEDLVFVVEKLNKNMNTPERELKYKISIFVLIFYTAIHILLTGIYKRVRFKEKAFLKSKLESSIQYELTESLHHELQGPISIIKGLVKNIYGNKYPCKKTIDGVCDFNNEELPLKECKDCKLRERVNKLKQKDSSDIKTYYSILLNLDRCKATLDLLAKSKHIKYKNGNSSLLEILENVLSTRKLLQVNKFNSNILDKEVLSTISIGKGLNNGLIMNVINNLVTNSLEANATEIVIKHKLDTDKKKCYLSIIDNGHGILDKKGKVIPTNQIFKYGFSTKDSENSPVFNIIKKLLNTILGSGTVHLSTRGAGLAISKNIMINGGGDLDLHQTSSRGTEFIITLPYKKKTIKK